MDSEIDNMINIMNNGTDEIKLLYVQKLIDKLENFKENILVISADTHTKIHCRKCEKFYSFKDDEIWDKERDKYNIIKEDITWNFYGNDKKVRLKNIDMGNFECNCSSCE